MLPELLPKTSSAAAPAILTPDFCLLSSKSRQGFQGRSPWLAFERVFKAFRAEHRPVGRLEDVLVEQMAVAYWKFSRFNRIESHLYQHAPTPANPSGEPTDPCFRYQDEPGLRHNEPIFTPDQLIVRAFISDTTGYNTFFRLSYFEMPLECFFYHAYHELERLQAKRTLSHTTP